MFDRFGLGGNLWWFLLSAVIGSLMPDIDICESWIGRRLGIISKPASWIFGHRGFFHSVWAGGILSLIFGLFFHSFWLGFLIGYLSHMLIDGLTKEGVALFYPSKFRIKGFVKTGGVLEWLLFLVLVGLVGLYYVKYIL